MKTKFRVWDTMENRYIYSDVGCQGHFMLSLDGTFHNLQNGSGGKEMIVEQFTGMRDTKGVEIFDGDIVCEIRTDPTACDESNVGIVYFAAGGFFINGDGPMFDHIYSHSPDILQDYYVIGNVRENPELLK